MKKTIREMENTLTYIENQTRRDNFIIRGVPDIHEETWSDCVKKVVDVRKSIGMDINHGNVRVHRRSGGPKPRPILAKMSNWKLKDEFMKNKRKLIGSSVVAQEDVAKKTLQEGKKLL